MVVVLSKNLKIKQGVDTKYNQWEAMQAGRDCYELWVYLFAITKWLNYNQKFAMLYNRAWVMFNAG